MEVQLQELINQIKKEGVEAAETEAQAIIRTAEENAEKIIADAKAQADKILQNAKAEQARMVQSGEDAIRQAGRNLLISFRESVARELEVIVGDEVSSVYSSEAFAKLIVKVVEGWTKQPDAEELSVILTAEDLSALEETVLAALKAKMLTGITLKAGDDFDGGFRISANNASAYYDYSNEAVVEMLSGYLSPKVAKLLKEAE